MKIPARIQIADGNLDLVFETRTVSGALRIAAQIDPQTNIVHVPGLGPVEDAEAMEVDLTYEGGNLH